MPALRSNWRPQRTAALGAGAPRRHMGNTARTSPAHGHRGERSDLYIGAIAPVPAAPPHVLGGVGITGSQQWSACPHGNSPTRCTRPQAPHSPLRGIPAPLASDRRAARSWGGNDPGPHGAVLPLALGSGGDEHRLRQVFRSHPRRAGPCELGMDPGMRRALGAMYEQLHRAFKVAGSLGSW